MFTGESMIGWFALLLTAMLFLLDFFYWKQFRKKIKVSVPWNVSLVFLIAFAGTGLFCVGLALRIVYGDLERSLGSAERWLVIGLLFFACAAICSYLHKKEEERNVLPLSQILLLPASAQSSVAQLSTEPLMLPVHIPKQTHLQLLENPKRKRQRLENRLAIIGIMAATMALLWFGVRFLVSTNLTAFLAANLPAERAMPTPTPEAEHELVNVLVAPQSFFSAAATGVRATFAIETVVADAATAENGEIELISETAALSIAPSELDSAVTAADLNPTNTIAISSTADTAPIEEPSIVDTTALADTGGTAVIAIGGPIDSGPESGVAPLAETLADELPPQTFDVVIQSEYGANIRARPSTESEIITALPTGIKLMAIGRSTDGEWVRVRLAISTGAWVAVEVVDDGTTIFKDGLVALPVAE